MPSATRSVIGRNEFGFRETPPSSRGLISVWHWCRGVLPLRLPSTQARQSRNGLWHRVLQPPLARTHVSFSPLHTADTWRQYWMILAVRARPYLDETPVRVWDLRRAFFPCFSAAASIELDRARVLQTITHRTIPCQADCSMRLEPKGRGILREQAVTDISLTGRLHGSAAPHQGSAARRRARCAGGSAWLICTAAAGAHEPGQHTAHAGGPFWREMGGWDAYCCGVPLAPPVSAAAL